LMFKRPMSLKMRTLQWKCKRQTMAVDHSDEGNSPANGSRSEMVLAKNWLLAQTPSNELSIPNPCFIKKYDRKRDMLGRGIATALLGVTYFFSENSSDGV
jgi:hypothetical protein